MCCIEDKSLDEPGLVWSIVSYGEKGELDIVDKEREERKEKENKMEKSEVEINNQGVRRHHLEPLDLGMRYQLLKMNTNNMNEIVENYKNDEEIV